MTGWTPLARTQQTLALSVRLHLTASLLHPHSVLQFRQQALDENDVKDEELKKEVLELPSCKRAASKTPRFSGNLSRHLSGCFGKGMADLSEEGR